MLVGSIIFGVGSLISLAFALSTDAVGTWRLAWARREAPGRLEGIENLGRVASDQNSPPLWRFRYRYSFRLPEGSPMRGTSYAEASSGLPSKDVTVEYDPRDPRINRIRGTRTRLCPLEDVFLTFSLFPLVGLAITAGAIWYGLRPIRVLERGESAVAMIVTYTLVLGTDGGAEYELPLEDFHRVRQTLGAANTPPQSPSDQRVGAAAPGPPGVTGCRFEFRNAGGDVVRTRGSVDLDGHLADSSARTVLYDPKQPRRALLLEELPAWVRVTPDGVWEAEDDPKKAGRMALLALCWFGGLPLGWILGQFPPC
jgi:hypothetical protein